MSILVLPFRIFLFFLGLAILWPFHPMPLGAFYSEILIFFGLSILIFVAGVFFVRAKVKYFISNPWIFFAFFSILILQLHNVVASNNSVGFSINFIYFLYLIAAALSFFVGGFFVKFFGLPWLVRGFGLMFLVVGVLSVFIQVIQLLNFERVFEPFVFDLGWSMSNRPYANIGQPNLLATFLMCSYASLFCFFNLNKYVFYAILSLIVFGLVLTGSRIVVVYFFVILFVSYFLFSFHEGARGLFLKIFLSILIYLFFYFSLMYFSGAVDIESGSVGRLSSFSSVERLNIYRVALALVFENYFLGVGPDGFVWKYLIANYNIGVDSFGLVHHSHNLFIQLAAEFGIFVSLGVFFIIFFRIFREMFFVRFGGFFDSSVFVVFSWIFIILAHSFLEFPLSYAYFIISFFIFLGAGLGCNSDSGMSFRSSFLGVFCVFFGIFGFVTSGKFLKDYRDVQIMMSAFATGGGYEHAMEIAVKPDLNFFQSYKAYVKFMIAPAEYLAKSSDFDEGVAAVQRHPYPNSLIKTAVVYSLRGDSSQAYLYRDIAFFLYPNSVENFSIQIQEACRALGSEFVCNLGL